jgi:hypothetical protein
VTYVAPQIRLEPRPITLAGAVDIEVLVLEDIDRQSPLARTAQQGEIDEKPPVMDADLGHMAGDPSPTLGPVDAVYQGQRDVRDPTLHGAVARDGVGLLAPRPTALQDPRSQHPAIVADGPMV